MFSHFPFLWIYFRCQLLCRWVSFHQWLNLIHQIMFVVWLDCANKKNNFSAKTISSPKINFCVRKNCSLSNIDHIFGRKILSTSRILQENLNYFPNNNKDNHFAFQSSNRFVFSHFFVNIWAMHKKACDSLHIGVHYWLESKGWNKN